MSLHVRPMASALAALALVVPTAATASAAPAPAAVSAKTRPAPASGLARVATLPGTGTVITSPKDGVAYTARVDAEGTVTLQRWTRRPDGTAVPAAVAVPQAGPYARVSLASGGGRTFLLVTSHSTTTLYEVVGTRLRLQSLPSAGPVAGTPIVHTVTAAEDGTPWVVLSVPIAPGAPVQDFYATHRDRRGKWTATATFRGPIVTVGRAFVSAGRVVVVGTTQGVEIHTVTWDGGAWRDEKVGLQKFMSNVRYDQTTTVSATDYTRWGFNLEQPQPAAPAAQLGVCSHVVDGQATPCPAPAWAVTAAVRLHDGRVVLGGQDARSQIWGRSAQGGVAVVESPGAVPASVTAEIGGGVVALAAADRGTTVWALTRDTTSGGSTSGTALQVLHLPKAHPAKR